MAAIYIHTYIHFPYMHEHLCISTVKPSRLLKINQSCVLCAHQCLHTHLGIIQTYIVVGWISIYFFLILWHHGGLIAMAHLLPRCTPAILPSELPGLMWWTWHGMGSGLLDLWIPPWIPNRLHAPGIFPTTSDSLLVCVDSVWHAIDGKCYGNPQLERPNPYGTNPCVHHMATLNPEILQHPKMLDPLPS